MTNAFADVGFLWAARTFGVGAPPARERKRRAKTDAPDWAANDALPATNGFVRALKAAFLGARA